jgi:hypothetical protein
MLERSHEIAKVAIESWRIEKVVITEAYTLGHSSVLHQSTYPYKGWLFSEYFCRVQFV